MEIERNEKDGVDLFGYDRDSEGSEDDADGLVSFFWSNW